jgi:glycosyltransferase involved in cell wall biosynthesis
LKVIVVQKGSREHFLAARALQQRGLLAGLVTDWYAPRTGIAWAWPYLLGKRRAACARAAECREIPREIIRCFPFRSLLWKWRVSHLTARGRAYEAYAQTDAEFAGAVAALNLPPHDVFFGYSYASLEAMEAEKKRGVLAVLGQIDAGPTHLRIVAEEMTRHPEIAGPGNPLPENYLARVRGEWKLADVILVNSEWSKEAIIADGADPSKIEIIPLAIEGQKDHLKTGTENFKGAKHKTEDHHASQPAVFNDSASFLLRVLYLGQVNVGKGIHYLMEAGRLLEGEKIHIDVVGPIDLRPQAVASAPRNMTFHGPVSRDRAAEWYRQSDVFVLPTLSDGFALTQLEALAHGLPVIVTPNCGHVVEEGRTGFIIPPRDAQALADALLRFVQHPSLAREMTPFCRQAVEAFSIDAYEKHLAEIIEEHYEFRPPALGSVTAIRG